MSQYGPSDPNQLTRPKKRNQWVHLLWAEPLALPFAAGDRTAEGPRLAGAFLCGIITNYPNYVRQIMADRGMRLPKAYERR
jgi:hypothetical protein